jgi:hypothetical protein
MTWKHPHSPVKKELKTVQSPGKVITAFWDVHGVPLVVFTPSGSTVNAAVYQETLKILKEAIRRKRPGLLTKGLGTFSFARQGSISQSFPNRESLEFLELGNSSTSSTQS